MAGFYRALVGRVPSNPAVAAAAANISFWQAAWSWHITTPWPGAESARILPYSLGKIWPVCRSLNIANSKISSALSGGGGGGVGGGWILF